MLVEYLVRLVICRPTARGYLKRRWVEPRDVVVPALQGWHLVGIEKMSLLLHEGDYGWRRYSSTTASSGSL